MTHVAKVDGAQMARNEISNRISKIDAIIEKIKTGNKAYSEKSLGKKLAAVLLGMVLFAIVFFSPSLVRAISLSLYGDYNTERLLATLGLYVVGAYFALILAKMLIQLKHINEIGNHIAGAEKIKSELMTNLGSIDRIVSDIECYAMRKNIVMTPARDIDGEIENFQKIASVYAEETGGIPSWIIKATYWIASVLFGVGTVTFMGPAVSEGICDFVGVECYEVMYVIYAVISLACYVLLHVLCRKEPFNFGTFILSLLSAPVAALMFYLICGAIGLAIYLLVFAGIIAIIIGIFAAIFNS